MGGCRAVVCHYVVNVLMTGHKPVAIYVTSNTMGHRPLWWQTVATRYGVSSYALLYATLMYIQAACMTITILY